MTPSTESSATWQLRRVRDQLTAQMAELCAVEGLPEAAPAADTIRSAAADVHGAARRVEQAWAQLLCDEE